MAFSIPKFNGRITITSSSNDRIDWYEEDGDGNNDNLNATIAAGTYYPGTDTEAGTLCKLIKDAMETASDAGAVGVANGGSGNNYAVSLNATTGIVTITASGSGSDPQWYPKIKTSESSKLLTGGDVSAGLRGNSNHFGWNVDSAYPLAATSHSSDVHPWACWYPDQPIQGGTKPRRKSVVIEAVTGGGNVQTYNFSGNPRDSSRNSYLDFWDLRITRLSETVRQRYMEEFYPYAKQGLPDGRFRYWEDRDDNSSYETVGLTGDILMETGFERTYQGYPYWTTAPPLKIRRYKS